MRVAWAMFAKCYLKKNLKKRRDNEAYIYLHFFKTYISNRVSFQIHKILTKNENLVAGKSVVFGFFLSLLS